MARLPAQKRLVKEDFPSLTKAIGQEAERLFVALNSFQDSMVGALNGGLTVEENLAAQVKTLELDAKFPQQFKTTVKAQVVGVFAVRALDISTFATVTSPVWVDWAASQDQIVLRNITGLTSGRKYRVTLVVLGGSTPTGVVQATTQASSYVGTSTPTVTLNSASWTLVGDVGAPAFLNSWVNYGSGNATAAYFKDPSGTVHLRGSVKSGTLTSPAFNLPAGYRPASTLTFACSSNGAFGSATVASTGEVTPQAGSNTSFALDTIQFRGEN